MKKFILYISIPLMLAMLACTDYSGEIESAYEMRLKILVGMPFGVLSKEVRLLMGAFLGILIRMPLMAVNPNLHGKMEVLKQILKA